MRRLPIAALAAALAPALATACGGSSPPAESSGASGSESAETSGGEAQGQQGGQGASTGSGEFQLSSSDTAGQAHGEHPSEIEATATHAAMRLFVVDPDNGPISGIVIKMTAPDGTAFYTRETDSVGYAEVLVPAGQRYEIEYLSLGRRNTSASVNVPAGPRQDIRLTMRYRRRREAPPEINAPAQPEERFVLEGILFDSNRATLQPDSFPRLDRVVEYMTHRPNTRIRVAGHTDNEGNPRRNQTLSEERARAVRDYLVSHGIDASRIEAVGYGDQRPIASNDTEEGRRQNRRIEAIEL